MSEMSKKRVDVCIKLGVMCISVKRKRPKDMPETTDIVETSADYPVGSALNAMLQVFERAVINPDIDLDKMIQLYTFQKEVMADQARITFNEDFAQMQAELPVIMQSGEIRHGDKLISKYAKYEDIMRSIQPVMSRWGFSVSFAVVSEQNQMVIRATLGHRAGHELQTSMTLPFDTSGAKNNVQSIGSTISYGKRYTLNALINIVTEGEDTDGEGLHVKIDEEAASDIENLLKQSGKHKGKTFHYLTQKYGVNIAKFSDIPEDKIEDVIEYIQS